MCVGVLVRHILTDKSALVKTQIKIFKTLLKKILIAVKENVTIKTLQKKGASSMNNIMGERIRALRKQHDLTQEALGKMIGVQKSAIRKYEKGEVENIPRSSLKIMADYFGVKPSYLMGFDEATERELQLQKEVEVCELFQDCYGKEALETISMFLKLDSYDRSAVTTMIQSLLSTEKYERE